MTFNDMTPSQKQAVLCDRNCIVTAGAGSGKTGVLSERFVRIVKEKKAHCNEILTLTFTRKATSEMKERIYQKLLSLKDEDELTLFSESTISTVDSFCSQIVRKACISYGLSTDFEILDIEDYKEIVQILAKKYIKDNLEKSFLSNLLKKYSYNDVIELLKNLAIEKLNIVSSYDAQKQAREYIDFSNRCYKESSEKLHELCKSYVDSLSDDSHLQANVNTLKAFLEGKISYTQIVFDSKKGNACNTDLAKELKNNIKSLVEEVSVYEIKDESFIYDFYDFTFAFKGILDDYKRSRASLVFADIMALSIDILKNNKEIRSYYKSKFKFIMIDEFQDNNDDYRKLVYLLSERYDLNSDTIPKANEIEKEKIFLVGDQKQSIYRFRGADVSVFRKMEKEISESDGIVVELDKNFRSTKSLVNSFNSIFSKVMKDSTQDYEAQFLSLKENEKNNLSSKIIFHNCFHPYHTDKSEYENPMANYSESEAYSIANLIQRMVLTDEFLIEDNRRPTYSDIAILFRSATKQDYFEKALRLQGIPYSLKETRSLMQEALVSDFYNALQLCIFPDDEISQKAFELSPLIKDLSSLRNVVKTSSIAQSISYIWYEMGYRLFIISNPANQAYTEHYNWLFSLAVYFDLENKGIVEFLDYIRPLLGQREKIRALNVLKEHSDGVQMMTIHSSKGLEFPIVIIADMDNSRTAPNKGLIFSSHEDFVYLPCSEKPDNKLCNVYDFANKGLEKNMENAEEKRLFYVAATRAKNHLVFSCDIAQTKKESEKTLQSLSSMFLEACPFDSQSQSFINKDDSYIETLSFDLIEESKTFSKQHLDQKRLDKVSQYYQAKDDDFKYEEESIAVTQLCKDQIISLGEKLSSLDSDDVISTFNLNTEFGTLVHSLIEKKIKGLKLDTYHNDKLTEKQNDWINNDALLLASSFINSSIYEDIKDKELYCEKSFVMNYENQVIEGTIDLFAIDEKSIYIIDFKTDMFKNPENHKKQLELYEKALSYIYPDKQISSSIVYLRELIDCR